MNQGTPTCFLECYTKTLAEADVHLATWGGLVLARGGLEIGETVRCYCTNFREIAGIPSRLIHGRSW